MKPREAETLLRLVDRDNHSIVRRACSQEGRRRAQVRLVIVSMVLLILVVGTYLER
jgi:hypothetical protein